MKLYHLSSLSILPLLAVAESHTHDHNHNHQDPERFSAKRLEELAGKWGTDV